MSPSEHVRTYPGKRGLDVVILAFAAIPVAIVASACALAVRFTSRGPILFRQTRIGAGERPFELLKFRTMIDAPDNPLFPDADRITSAGRWMRRLSLDELPQLWNVVRGDMSIVGPRPTLPYQLELFDERQRGRYRVVPGLTGLAQVRGRNEITWSERVEHDLEYVQRLSLRLDLWILLRTPFAVLGSAEGHPVDDPLTRNVTIDELDGAAIREKVRIDVYWDYMAFPLSNTPRGNLKSSLSLSEGLRRDLQAWSDDQTARADYLRSADAEEAEAVVRRWSEEGSALRDRVEAELGMDYEVHYHDPYAK